MEEPLDGKVDRTYVFEVKEALNAPSKLRQKIWQIFPSVCGSMMCVPFGMMLGWPSPFYPTLLQDNSPVRFTIDESAMIAGFLMIGNTLPVSFSHSRRFGAKYGVIFGALLMLISWIVMWQARNIFYLLGSRLINGFGHAYGMGQLKIYITEMCQENLRVPLIKTLNLYVFFGVFLSFVIGPFVEFRQFSIICVIINILVLFLTIFLPSTPRQLIQNGKLVEARKLLGFLRPHINTDEEILTIKQHLCDKPKDVSFLTVIKDATLRKSFMIFAFLVFFQQFSGITSTIVYCQFIFSKANVPRPELCAILYVLVYALSNAYGIFFIPNYSKKLALIFSEVTVAIVLIVQIIVITEYESWRFAALVLLLLYNVFHTIGLGNIPFQLIPVLFPPEAVSVAVDYFIMSHSILGLIITKIFQVMTDRVGLYAPFSLYLTITAFSLIFTVIFIPNKKPKAEPT